MLAKQNDSLPLFQGFRSAKPKTYVSTQTHLIETISSAWIPEIQRWLPTRFTLQPRNLVKGLILISCSRYHTHRHFSSEDIQKSSWTTIHVGSTRCSPTDQPRSWWRKQETKIEPTSLHFLSFTQPTTWCYSMYAGNQNSTQQAPFITPNPWT